MDRTPLPEHNDVPDMDTEQLHELLVGIERELSRAKRHDARLDQLLITHEKVHAELDERGGL